MPKKKKTKKKVKKKIASKKTKETIYKTQKDWISKAIVNKSQYLKKYIMMKTLVELYLNL